MRGNPRATSDACTGVSASRISNPITSFLGLLRPKARGDRRAEPRGVEHVSRSSSLTMPGFMFVFVAVFLALGAINGQNNLLFWLFGFAIAALVISGIVTGNALMSLSLVAHPPVDGEEGAPVEIRYTLVNRSRTLPNFAIEIEELGVGGERSRPFVSGRLGVVLHIPPGASASGASGIVFPSRGVHALGRVAVRTRFPFGLFVKTIVFEAPRRVTVYPKRVALDRDMVAIAATHDESSDRHIAKRGQGLEYYGVRAYQPGDPLRSIAWKHSARRGELHVKEYPDPVASSRVIELVEPDAGVTDEAFEHAVRVVYSMLAASTPRSKFGLSVPWVSVSVPPGSGEMHARRAGRALAVLTRGNDRLGSGRPPRGTVRIGYGGSRRGGVIPATDLAPLEEGGTG